MPRISKTELIQLVVAAVKPPRRNLASAVVTIREGGGLFLQNYDDISPVIFVEMILEPVPSLRGPQTSGKRAGAMCCDFCEAGVVHLGEVFHLNDWKPVTVYFRIFTVHPSPIRRHVPSGQFNDALQARYPSPKLLNV